MRQQTFVKQIGIIFLSIAMVFSNVPAVYANEPVPETIEDAVTPMDGTELQPESEKSIFDPILTYEKTAHSIKITVDLSDSYKALLSEKNISSVQISMNVRYPWKLSADEHLSITCSKSNSYQGSRTLVGELSGVPLELTFTKNALDSWDSAMNYTETVTMEESTVKGTVTLTGENPLENNGAYYADVNVQLTEGYGTEEYSVTLHYYYYVNEYRGTADSVLSGKLNSGNNYTLDTKKAFQYEPGKELKAWVVLKDSSGNRFYLGEYSLDTNPSSNSDILEVSSSDVTYTTARLNVKIKDFSAFGGSDLKIFARLDQKTEGLAGITGTCGSKYYQVTKKSPQTTVTMHKMGPGRTYHVYLNIENASGVEYTNIDTGFEFATPSFREFQDYEGPAQHTKEEIRQKWNSLSLNLSKADKYEKSVDHTTGGVLDSATLQNGINIVNMIRYCAGIPADLAYDKGDSSIVNAGCELDRMLGQLTHYPSKPSSVSTDFYNRGYIGTSSSNLYCGTQSIPASVIGWMQDGGENNTANGHRSWNMDPDQTFMGFGASGSYRGQYVYNYRNIRNSNVTEPCFYTWPAKYTPVELYVSKSSDYSNSVFLEKYDNIDKSKIRITVKNTKTGKTVTLGSSDYATKPDSKYWYCTSNQLIFFTGSFAKGDKVSVHVDGLTVGDVEKPLDYTMEFFSIKDVEAPKVPVASVRIGNPVSELYEGDTVSLWTEVLPDTATDRSIRWSVESVDGYGKAEIDSSGKLLAVMDGTVLVKATSVSTPAIYDSFTLNIKEKVVPAQEILLDYSELSLKVGESRVVGATVVPEDATATDVIFTSEDPTRVKAEGDKITALAATDSPVNVRASVTNKDGSVITKDLPVTCISVNDDYDREYGTRLYGLSIEGQSRIQSGDTSILKVKPLSMGTDFVRGEYLITVAGAGSSVSIREMEESEILESERNTSSWFEITGLSGGKAELIFTAKSLLPGTLSADTASKKFILNVVDSIAPVPEGTMMPVLVSSSMTLNTYLEKGVKLDIRSSEGADAMDLPVLSSANGCHSRFSVSLEDHGFYLQADPETPIGTYRMTIDLSGGNGEAVCALTCKVVKSQPKIKIKQSGTLDVSDWDSRISLNVTAGAPIESLSFTDGNGRLMQTADAVIAGSSGSVKVGLNPAGTGTGYSGYLTIKCIGYRDPLIRYVRISNKRGSVKSNMLSLDRTKISMNVQDPNRRGVVINAKIKNSDTPYPGRIVVRSADERGRQAILNQDFSFSYAKSSGRLTIRPVRETLSGKYKFKVEAYLEDESGREKLQNDVQIQVSIIKKAPSLSLKASGKIDTLVRDSSVVSVKCNLKNLSAGVADVAVDDVNGQLFTVRATGTDRLEIRPRAGAGLKPKSTYTLQLTVRMDNGYVFENRTVKVKTVRSSLKATAVKSLTVYRQQKEDAPLNVRLKKPAAGTIAKIDAAGLPYGMVCRDGMLHVENKNVLRPGNYSLVLTVIPAGADRGLKPATVKVKLTVK